MLVRNRMVYPMHAISPSGCFGYFDINILHFGQNGYCKGCQNFMVPICLLMRSDDALL